MNIGIIGLGTYLPDNVRRNDWWEPELVESWKEKRKNRMVKGAIPEGVEMTEGVRLVLEEQAAIVEDPFQGGVERRVMPDDMTSTDMEVIAAQRALEDAGISPEDIDVVLMQSMCPDHVIVNGACAVHHRLGIKQRALSLETQGVCNGFLLQLHAAQQMLAGGAFRYALLIQSAPTTRLMERHEPFSVWFGDGASAVVLGPVSEGRGISAVSTRTDGSVFNALLGASDRPAPWYELGEVRIRAVDPRLGRKMLLQSADLGKQALDDVMSDTGTAPADVDFFACHQVSSWFRRAAQKLAGLEHARTVDTYQWAGNLTSANLPLVLDVARKEHLLRDGDLVALYAGGGGMTWSAALLRWGR